MAKPTVPKCQRAALHYAKAFGWKIFPANVAKKKSYLSAKHAPDGARWGMTSDPDQLKKNFNHPKWRDICGVGVPTGVDNGIFDFEADTPKGHGVDGIASIEVLEKEHGNLPKTLMARSPTGSIHRIYNHPGGKVWSSASYIAPGIDIRGDGGMFVAPPSEREDGTYEWLNDEPIADAPQWLIDLVTRQPDPERKKSSSNPDPFEAFGQEQTYREPLDIDGMWDGLQYPGNVHDTQMRVSASLLSRGEPIENVVGYISEQIRLRVPESSGWNWDASREGEIGIIRDNCASWVAKHAELLELQEEELPEWFSRDRRIKPLLNGQGNGAAKPQVQLKAQPQPQPLEYISGERLEKEFDVVPVEWLVQHFIMRDVLNAIFGDGATGKDYLLLQLSIAMACEKHWLGREVTPGKVLYFNVEDRTPRIRWRQHQITEYLKTKCAKYPDRIRVVPMVGQNTIVAAFDSRSGLVQPTPVLTSIRNLVESYRPDLVVMGNRVNIFGINQNEDSQARQCIELLNAVSIDYNTTLIMPGHVSVRGQSDKTGSSASGSSGSVQWSNGVRHRLLLSKPEKDDEAPMGESYKRTLTVLKSNDAPTDKKIELRWSEQHFLYIADDEHLDIVDAPRPSQAEMDAEVEEEVMRLVRIALSMGQRLSTQSQANNSASTLFAKRSDCKYRGKRELLARAVERLFHKGKLDKKPYGPPSDRTFMIILGEDNVVPFPKGKNTE